MLGCYLLHVHKSRVVPPISRWFDVRMSSDCRALECSRRVIPSIVARYHYFVVRDYQQVDDQ